MKTIDRYIVGSFLRNYALSLLVLLGLYVVLDMVFNFDELLAIQSRSGGSGLEGVLAAVREAADYYFHQSFLYFVQLSGVIPVVAAAFTLMRMSHGNELAALLAAGVPLLRVASPMILAALVLCALVVVDQELLIPNMIGKLSRRHGDLGDVTRSAFPIRAMQDENRALLVAGQYQPAASPPAMRAVSIVTRKGSMPQALITAQSAQWDAADRSWILTGGQMIDGLADNEHRRHPIDRYRSNITPEKIRLWRSSEFVSLLSTSRINELLSDPHIYGKSDLVRAKHARFAQPLVNAIMVLLAVGCVLTRDPKMLKLAAGKCVLLCGLCMGSSFLAQHFAVQLPEGSRLADAWPALMAWMPVFVFGPLAVWMLDRVKT